jgi:hypothetical protein
MLKSSDASRCASLDAQNEADLKRSRVVPATTYLVQIDLIVLSIKLWIKNFFHLELIMGLSSESPLPELEQLHTQAHQTTKI